MRDRIELNGEMPGYWPPKPARVWDVLLSPLHRAGLRHHRIAEVVVRGMENLARLDARDGALVCPNHSYTGDGSVMLEIGRRALRQNGRRFYTMAAWHGFRGHGGLDGWLLQRMGVFSVDREGCDRRAIRQATELLATGNGLIIFPEGEIYHLNERLTPLREGVAFMAVTAQRELDRSKSNARVCVIPTAIRYEFTEDVTVRLEQAVEAMEQRLLVKPNAGAPLHQRILAVGEILLTIKEKQYLGQSGTAGDMPARIKRLIEYVLSRSEQAHLERTHADEPVPVRVKQLRRKLLEAVCDDQQQAETNLLPAVRDALADVHLALQLYSYPGDYLVTKPTPERMAETIEKFVEDMDDVRAMPIGWRRATVTIGEPIDVRESLGSGKARVAVAELTARLEREMQEQMSRGAAPV
jgi:1-acyl-sn-glycerol-3-phosphate acyltransferase